MDLKYDSDDYLFKLPVFLGYHDEDKLSPFWCSIDTSLPTIIVPSFLCQNCEGKQFTPSVVKKGGRINKNDRFLYPHKMMYQKYTEGSFTVRNEQEFMMLDYEAGEEMKQQVYFEDFEFLSIVLDHDQ